MFISQKIQYAVRAIFELSKRSGEGPVKIAEIARIQGIPPRFLEVILNQLKKGGLVESRRGIDGGYHLTSTPDKISAGDVIQLMQGTFDPVECLSNGSKDACQLYGSCVFLPLWKKASDAVKEVYFGTTFQDLIDSEKELAENFISSYSI